MQRNRRATIGDGICRRPRLAARRIPQLRRFAVHAEDRIHIFCAVVAIVDEIEIAIREFAMHEHQVASGSGFVYSKSRAIPSAASASSAVMPL